MRKVALNLALRHVVSGSDRSDSCRGRDGVIQMGKSAVVRKPTSNAAAMFTMKFRTSPRLLIVCWGVWAHASCLSTAPIVTIPPVIWDHSRARWSSTCLNRRGSPSGRLCPGYS